MKSPIRIALVLAAGHAGMAAASPELAQEKQCGVCHTADKEMVGPSYRAIADRYGGQPEAVDMLVAKVKSGGMGHWGEAIMAPTSARAPVSDDEAARLVKWILEQK